MNAGKGKKQVVLTLSDEAYDRLQQLAKEADRTLAGYLRWVFYSYLRELETGDRDQIV